MSIAIATNCLGQVMDCRFQDLPKGTAVSVSYPGAITAERIGSPFSAKILHITEKAFLLEMPSGSRQWFPRKVLAPSPFASDPRSLVLSLSTKNWLDPEKWATLAEAFLKPTDLTIAYPAQEVAAAA